MRYKKARLLQSPAVSRIKLYEEAEAVYQAAKEAEETRRLEAERQRKEIERHEREAERARQEALRAQQRKREQYWESLGGIEFEQELGKLFMARGYHMQSTPRTGDEGVDLVVTKNGKTTVVQCKAQKARAGQPVVRDLYGSVFHFRADKAILACTGGFTKGVYEFVQGKPIILIDSSDIARVADAVPDTPT
jgi:restriction endonuclease Mrr